MKGATIKRIIKTVNILKGINLIIKDNFFVNKITINRGRKNTNELIFTPRARPRKIDARRICLIFLCSIKYNRNKRDVKIKKIK